MKKMNPLCHHHRDKWPLQNTLSIFDSIERDLGYALRTLRRNPGFALTAILILALGIGANTAIFSLMNAVLLRSLPVKDPSSLVRLTMNVQMGSQNVQNIPNRLNGFRLCPDFGITPRKRARLQVSARPAS